MTHACMPFFGYCNGVVAATFGGGQRERKGVLVHRHIKKFGRTAGRRAGGGGISRIALLDEEGRPRVGAT